MLKLTVTPPTGNPFQETVFLAGDRHPHHMAARCIELAALLTFAWLLQWFTTFTQTQRHPCRDNKTVKVLQRKEHFSSESLPSGVCPLKGVRGRHFTTIFWARSDTSPPPSNKHINPMRRLLTTNMSLEYYFQLPDF